MQSSLEYERCLDIICDAVELLRKRKLRADEDRIQSVLKPHKWTPEYLMDKIQAATKEARICKLMYKDNFGYRTANRISDKMAARIIPFLPEHPDEIPENVYDDTLKMMRKLQHILNDGVDGDYILENLKHEKKLLNYNKSAFRMVLYGLQLKDEIIQCTHKIGAFACKDGIENTWLGAPLPNLADLVEDVRASAPKVENEPNGVVQELSDNANATNHEGTATELSSDKTEKIVGDNNISDNNHNKEKTYTEIKQESKTMSESDDTSEIDSTDSSNWGSWPENSKRKKPEKKQQLSPWASSDSSNDSDSDANESTEAAEVDPGVDIKEDKIVTQEGEEEPSEPAVNESTSSAPGRRRRVNSRYINDFYLTSSSTKGGRGSKEDYTAIASKLKLKGKGKCSDCGGPIRDELGVCIKCLFPETKATRNKRGYKRKVVAPPTEETAVKSGKLARQARSARRSGTTSKLASQINTETKGPNSSGRRVTVDSNEDKNDNTWPALHSVEDIKVRPDNDGEWCLAQQQDNYSVSLLDRPTSTGEQTQSSMFKDNLKNKSRSKHYKEGSLKTFTCNNGLVTDKQQKPQLPLRFIPNRKRPEPDRSSESIIASSNTNMRTYLDDENNLDDATGTSILDFPTKQLAATANENNHSTNGIFVPSAPSCSLDDFEPQYWTSEDVAQFISSKGFIDEARLFKEQDVDGLSLLLMQRADFLKGLSMKLGPALKIYDHICRLKENYLPICYP